LCFRSTAFTGILTRTSPTGKRSATKPSSLPLPPRQTSPPGEPTTAPASTVSFLIPALANGRMQHHLCHSSPATRRSEKQTTASGDVDEQARYPISVLNFLFFAPGASPSKPAIQPWACHCTWAARHLLSLLRDQPKAAGRSFFFPTLVQSMQHQHARPPTAALRAQIGPRSGPCRHIQRPRAAAPGASLDGARRPAARSQQRSHRR
jgi:hypothetical protein